MRGFMACKQREKSSIYGALARTFACERKRRGTTPGKVTACIAVVELAAHVARRKVIHVSEG